MNRRAFELLNGMTDDQRKEYHRMVEQEFPRKRGPSQQQQLRLLETILARHTAVPA